MATQAIGLGWLRMLTSPADVGVYDVGATTTHIAAELAAVLDHIEHEQEH